MELLRRWMKVRPVVLVTYSDDPRLLLFPARTKMNSRIKLASSDNTSEGSYWENRCVNETDAPMSSANILVSLLTLNSEPS